MSEYDETSSAPESDPFEDEGESIPVTEVAPVSAARAPVEASGSGDDWTRTDPIRDDPGTFGEEARRLWDTLRGQLVDPLLRNYPEAAGHLTTAGSEVAEALRSLLRGAEQRWTGSGGERPRDGGEDRRDE
ncbi:MAG TPA: DUF5304 family protein [Actinocrinis sp.]